MPRPARIDSTQNPRVAQWRALSTVQARTEQGVFLAEGPHLVEEALRGSLCPPRVVLVSDDHDGAMPSIPRGIEVVSLASRVFNAVCDSKSPQGIAAICALPEEGPVAGPGRWLIAEEVQDPGHAGTLVRICHAAGWSGVVLGPSSADPFGPKAVRASQGSVFHTPVTRGAVGEWVEKLRANGCRIVASVVAGGSDYRMLLQEAPANLALLVGGEARGLSAEVIDAADARATIPLPGGAESLSLPVAAGILVFACGGR
jgi:TrmH family RNA methyltransferase